MSSRRPKAQVIRNESSDEDLGGKSADNVQKTNNNQADSDTVDQITFQVKRKEKKSKSELPLFGQLDIEESPQNIHSLDDLKVKTREQQEAFNDHDQKTENSKPYISSVNPNSPPNINEYDNSPTDLKNNVSNISDNSHDDFIPLDVSDSEEITMQNVNVDLLDDGRLPVTEKEEILQRKLEQKEMERNFYDVELSSDNDLEMDDWEASKLKSGNILKSDIKKPLNLPKLNLVAEESLVNEITHVKDMIDQLQIKLKQNELDSQNIQNRKAEILKNKENTTKYLQKLVLDFKEN
ncbi:unnamed protein product [Wickerhamomyces anomalus]